MIFQQPILEAPAAGLELVDYRIVREGLERFEAAVPRCPRQFTPPRPGAPNGVDLQQDWAYIPNDAQPWGTHCEEWSDEEADAFNASASRLMQVVKKAHGWTSEQAEAADIWPNVPYRLSLLVRQTRNLLAAYERLSGMAVTASTTGGRPLWPWILGAGLAVAATGGLVLVSARPTRTRR